MYLLLIASPAFLPHLYLAHILIAGITCTILALRDWRVQATCRLLYYNSQISHCTEIGLCASAEGLPSLRGVGGVASSKTSCWGYPSQSHVYRDSVSSSCLAAPPTCENGVWQIAPGSQCWEMSADQCLTQVHAQGIGL